MLNRKTVYEMLTKDAYVREWGESPEHVVSRETGQPFTTIEWLNFVQKYIDEARLAHSNYTPDLGALRIRLIKAASLLVTALQVHGKPEDLDRLAGVASSTFPVLHDGLQTFEAVTDADGTMKLKPVGELVED